MVDDKFTAPGSECSENPLDTVQAEGGVTSHCWPTLQSLSGYQ